MSLIGNNDNGFRFINSQQSEGGTSIDFADNNPSQDDKSRSNEKEFSKS
jgi:hypothetical protein